MAYDAAGAYDAVCALVAGLPGVQKFYRGVPESLTNQLCAYATLGGATVVRKVVGRIDRRELRVRVYFAYRVVGAEANAEAALAAFVDALMSAVGADPTLGGVAHDATLDAGLADAPEYAVVAGQEYRVWPATVTVTQDQYFDVAAVAAGG